MLIFPPQNKRTEIPEPSVPVQGGAVQAKVVVWLQEPPGGEGERVGLVKVPVEVVLMREETNSLRL